MANSSRTDLYSRLREAKEGRTEAQAKLAERERQREELEKNAAHWVPRSQHCRYGQQTPGERISFLEEQIESWRHVLGGKQQTIDYLYDQIVSLPFDDNDRDFAAAINKKVEELTPNERVVALYAQWPTKPYYKLFDGSIVILAQLPNPIHIPAPEDRGDFFGPM